MSILGSLRTFAAQYANTCIADFSDLGDLSKHVSNWGNVDIRCALHKCRVCGRGRNRSRGRGACGEWGALIGRCYLRMGVPV